MNFFEEYEAISKALDGHESRPEQIEMAAAVDNALRDENHLIVEAGTGVGKSLAYLLPLIRWVLNNESEHRKAVVSTYTKALQRQLFEKELPLLKDKIFNELRFALCLGSENYLCLRRLEKTKTLGLFDEPLIQINSLLRWAKRTSTGIKAELYAAHYTWQKVCRESDACYGKDCKKYDICFYQKAKAKERMSHILVTNHHLFFANVVSDWKVIPHFNVCVFDEAHELEDVAADYLGVEVSNMKFKYLLDSIISPTGKGLLIHLKWLSANALAEIGGMVNLVRLRGEAFFNELDNVMGESSTKRVYQQGIVKDNLSEGLLELSKHLKSLGASSQDEDEQRDISAHAMRCDAFRASLKSILDQELENHVYWAERDRRRARIVATPIDVASILKARVFDVLSSTVLSSATLATNGRFDYIKQRLGLPDAKCLLLHSPFNYKEQSLLYIPDDIVDPNNKEFEESLIKRLKEILNVMMGRTLVLFTNYKLLTTAYNDIEIAGLKLFRQGDMDSYSLISEFRSNSNSALFGTYTFWQGIDIPGDDLQCVVITKLPFAVPDEPIIQARTEAVAMSGKNPFYDYQVPQAAILLKQGFGRLIRTKKDRGVVAILDTRVMTKGYGRQFLKSLPDSKITASLDELRHFIDNMREERHR